MVKHIFNILSVSSFALSGGIIASGVYVYANREAIIDEVKAQVVEAATGAIQEQLPDLLDGALPSTDIGIPAPGGEGEGGGIPTTLPAF